jgi:putative endonuclease
LRSFYVYIMANEQRTIYVGVTNDLARRVGEHKCGRRPGFTSRYGLSKLVYVEETTDVRAAIAREKQIKGWARAKKLALIATSNPEWDDLAALCQRPPASRSARDDTGTAGAWPPAG